MRTATTARRQKWLVQRRGHGKLRAVNLGTKSSATARHCFGGARESLTKTFHYHEDGLKTENILISRIGIGSLLRALTAAVALLLPAWFSSAASYSLTLQPGVNLIANHLNQGDNNINTIIPDIVDAATLVKWDDSAQAWGTQEEFFLGWGWFPGTNGLNPGEMAAIVNPDASSPFTLTFMGDEQAPNLPRDLLANGQKYGYGMQTVSTGTFEAITGRSPGEGSQLLRFNTESHALDTYTYSNAAWNPATPTVAIGEGVLIVGPSINQPCVIISCPSDVHAASSDGSPVNVPYTVTTSNYCGLGPVRLTCSPATPGPFPVGTNLVVCVASVTNTPTTTYDVTCSFRVVVASPSPGLLTIVQSGSRIILNWAGSFTLQSATNVLGPFSDLPGPVSHGPYTNAMGAQNAYFRLRQ